MLEVLFEKDLVLSLFLVFFLALLKYLVEFRGKERISSLKFDSVESSLSVFFFIITESLVVPITRIALTLFQN
jgi:hypothetical protein